MFDDVDDDDFVDDHDVDDDDDGGDDDVDDGDDDTDDDALPVVFAGPGKTQAFAVCIYIYIYIGNLTWQLKILQCVDILHCHCDDFAVPRERWSLLWSDKWETPVFSSNQGGIKQLYMI